MFEKKIDRRHALRLMGLTAAGAMAAACTPKAEPTAAPAATKAPDAPAEATKAPEVKEWTLIFDAAGATPTDMETAQEGDVIQQGLQPAADDYKDVKPGVTIEWYRFPQGSNRTEWLNARIAAQDCPDMYWMNADALWPHVNKGWALDFTEYAKSPNPYMPGNKNWEDYIDFVGRTSQIGPDGKVYGINLDGAGVLWIVNRDAYDKAGVTELPKTWSEFMAGNEKLKESGIVPIGGDFSQQCCFTHWTHGHVFGWLAWDNIYDFDDDGDLYVTTKEMAEYYQRGEFPLWEEFTRLAELFREQEPYLPLGYQGEVAYRDMFRRGEVAAYMEGNWTVTSFIKDPPPFEYTWMNYPQLTKAEWPGCPDDKKVRLQGPWGGMQYHVPGYLPETDPERIPVIMDWLMFITQPKYVEPACAERGTVPMVEGAEAMPEIAPFTAPYDRAVPYQSWASLSAPAYESERALLAEYAGSTMSNDELVSRGKEVWEEEVKNLLESNPDWTI